MDYTQTMTPMEFGEWGNARPMVPHDTLRFYEKIFPEVHFHEGAPFVPWTSILNKIPHNRPRSLSSVVAQHFQGERLLVGEFDAHLSTEHVVKSHIHETTYLRLEYALIDDEMRVCVERIHSDWGAIRRVDNQRAVFEGQRDPSLLYEPQSTPGVYVIQCGTTEAFTGLRDGPVIGGKASYVLKIGCSDDITRSFAEQAAPNSDFAGVMGRVEFLFGLAVASNEVTNAEEMLHGKLTQLGFARPVVIQFPIPDWDAYECNAISLPLVHDVVRKLRCVVPPPPAPDSTAERL